MNIDFLYLIIFFGAGLSLLLALSQLLNRPMKTGNRLLMLFFLSLAIFQFQQFFIGGWLGKKFPWGHSPSVLTST